MSPMQPSALIDRYTALRNAAERLLAAEQEREAARSALAALLDWQDERRSSGSVSQAVTS
jgi:hypothetical protein